MDTARFSPTLRHIFALALACTLIGLFLWFVAAKRSSRHGIRLPRGQYAPLIRLGDCHGIIRAPDGTLWTWGSDFLGWPVLGLGNVHRNAELRLLSTNTDWIDVSAGASHSVGIRADGSLWTWGESVGPRGIRPAPVPIPVAGAPGNDWKQAAAGGVHLLAIKRDGTLWGWGNNWAGSVGNSSKAGSSAPVQIDPSTNWSKVWAGMLESLGLQSDGSLWYWGDNLDPTQAQGTNIVAGPQRVGSDNDWSDVAIGVNTIFAIKTNGTLWAWGRHAEVFTGATNVARDVAPMRVGTESNWHTFSACFGWWIQGLTKKDGSLWVMDASEGKPNGPGNPPPPAKFRNVAFNGSIAASALGSVHAAAAGVHAPINVIITPDGEVWTWGMVLGEPMGPGTRVKTELANAARFFHLRVMPPAPPPVLLEKPWRL